MLEHALQGVLGTIGAQLWARLFVRLKYKEHVTILYAKKSVDLWVDPYIPCTKCALSVSVGRGRNRTGAKRLAGGIVHKSAGLVIRLVAIDDRKLAVDSRRNVAAVVVNIPQDNAKSIYG